MNPSWQLECVSVVHQRKAQAFKAFFGWKADWGSQEKLSWFWALTHGSLAGHEGLEYLSWKNSEFHMQTFIIFSKIQCLNLRLYPFSSFAFSPHHDLSKTKSSPFANNNPH